MKNPKILPFGQWFKVYESAGRNFEKSQRILESRIARGLTRIYEGNEKLPMKPIAESTIAELSEYLDDGAKAALVSVDALCAKPFSLYDYPFPVLSSDAYRQYSGMVKDEAAKITGNLQTNASDAKEYGKIVGKITTTNREITFNNASKSDVLCNVPYDTEGLGYGVASKEKDATKQTRNVAVPLTGANVKNLYAFLERITSTMNDSFDGEVIDKYLSIDDSTYYITESQNRLTFTACSDLSWDSDGASWTGTSASGVAPKTWLDLKTGIATVEGILYSVKAVNSGAGATLPIADFIKKVSVKTSTDQVQHEGKLENANELFVVGQTTYKDPAEGPNKLKAAIQTLFNEFSSIESVTVLGGASNEGPEKLNKQLVDGRAKVIADLIKATWPELAAGTTAVQGDYTKIQPKDQPTSADYRTAYLFIKGTKTSTTTTELPGADLALTEMKKDQVIITEHTLKCTIDMSKNTSFTNSKMVKKLNKNS